MEEYRYRVNQGFFVPSTNATLETNKRCANSQSFKDTQSQVDELQAQINEVENYSEWINEITKKDPSMIVICLSQFRDARLMIEN